MRNPYREIFRAPGSAGFCFAAFIARMPISMLSLGLVTLFAALHYSYSTSTSVVAVYVLMGALMGPQLSRLADRYGQQRIVLFCSPIAISSLLCLLYAIVHRAPVWLLLFLSAGIGFLPNFGTLVRVRWTKIYSGSPKLRTAFAFESIADELIFIIGPILAIFLSTNIAPILGTLAAAGFLAVGSILFLLQKKTAPKPFPHTKGSKNLLLAFPLVFFFTVNFLAIGSVYTSAEIATLAFCRSIHMQTYASIPLMAYASGSLISGIIYGIVSISVSLRKQYMINLAFLALTSLPLLFVQTLPMLTLVLFIAGGTCAPLFIITTALLEEFVPEENITEGLTWVMTGLAIGVSIGAALAGRVIDFYGPHCAYTVTIIGGVFSFLIAPYVYYLLGKEEAK